MFFSRAARRVSSAFRHVQYSFLGLKYPVHNRSLQWLLVSLYRVLTVYFLMGRTSRLKLFRDEMAITSLDHDEVNRIGSIRYDPESLARLMPGAGTEVMVTGFPLLIYEYSFTVTGDANFVLYQTAIQANNDTDVKEDSRNWNSTNQTFVKALRKYGVSPGDQANYASKTINFKARKNPKHLQKKFGKYRIPPIMVGPDGLDYLCWMVINKTPLSTNRTVYSILDIKHWKQLT